MAHAIGSSWCCQCHAPAGNVHARQRHDAAQAGSRLTSQQPMRLRGFQRKVTRQRQAKHSIRAATENGSAAAEAAVEQQTIPPKLNATPMRREARKHFYDDAVEAMKAALADGKLRIRLRCTIPELNVETDVYRIGTLLEMVRDMATALAVDGKKVKVCVQAAMGDGVFQGLPLSLSGVKRIMTSMEWGDAEDFVTIGAVGTNEVDDSDYYILVAPQNVIGHTILTSLGDHVAAAEAKGKPVILVNPALKDIPSHSRRMGIRGRADRMAFADSFAVAYHFRLLFLPGSYFPIMGALRYSYGKEWEVYKRADIGKKNEEYQHIGSFDHEPNGTEITACFKPKPVPVTPGRWW